MRAASILLLAVLGLAAQAALADEGLGLSDEALMAPLSNDEPLAVASHQRAVLQSVTKPPYYCANSHLKSTFTAKFAFLLQSTGRHPRPTSALGVNLFLGKIRRRLHRYNRRYRLKLTFKLIQKTSGATPRRGQKWFYYEIIFHIGTCGLYKFPLVTQLRGDIQPSASFLKLVRVLDYTVKK
jgi:hypothetical protein